MTGHGLEKIHSAVEEITEFKNKMYAFAAGITDDVATEELAERIREKVR